MLIDRIKPSGISGCHGLIEIWSKKTNFNPRRTFGSPALGITDRPLHKALHVNCYNLENTFVRMSLLVWAALKSYYYKYRKPERSPVGREGRKRQFENWQQLTAGFVQWPSEYILIDRIKPSDISGWHGLLDIWSKKRNLTQERLFVRLSCQELRSATAQSPIRCAQL